MPRLRSFLADLALIPAAWSVLFYLTRKNLTARHMPSGTKGRKRFEAHIERLNADDARWAEWRQREASSEDRAA